MASIARAFVLLCVHSLACAPLPPGGDTETTGTGETTGTSEATTTSTSETTTTTGIEPTTTTSGPTTESTTEPPAPVCGDGVVQAGEECDDGNGDDGDCCTSVCTKGQEEPGQVCWTVTVEGSDNGEDLAGGIAVDGAGDIYLDALVVDQLAGPDALIRKLDPGGNSLWTQQYDGGVNGIDAAIRLAAEPSGFMVAVGRQTVAQGQPGEYWLSKCTPTGQLVWQFTAGTATSGSAVAMSGSDFVVAGSIKQGNDTDGWVRKYDGDGGEIWTNVHTGGAGGLDSLSGVAVDGAGNVYAAGRESTMQGFDILVRSWGPDGSPRWMDLVDGGMQGNDWALDVATDPDDGVYVAGRVETGGGFSDAWLRKYSDAGEALWTGTYAGAFGESDDATAIAATAGGGFVAAGGTAVGDGDRDLWIRRYDPTGAEIWTDVVAGMNMGDDAATDVAFMPDGGVVVIGTLTVVPELNSDVWVRKYGP